MKTSARVRTAHLFAAVEPRQGALFSGEHAPAEAPPVFVGRDNLPRERRPTMKREIPEDFFLVSRDSGRERFRIEVLAADNLWHDAGGNDDGIDALMEATKLRDRCKVRVRDLRTGEVLT